MSEPIYDPVTRITAGELRQMGLELPESIPDVAHISRSAMCARAATQDPIKLIESGGVVFGIDIYFTEEFVWYQLDCLVSKMAEVE